MNLILKFRTILTPPADNKMEFVAVTADQGVFVTKEYGEEQLTK